MDKKLKRKIIKFYEQEILNRPDESIIDFKYKSQIGHEGYEPEMISDEQQRYEKLSPSPLSIAISKREKVPQNLLNACDRISWYLKHNMGEIVVVKLPFEEIITFAICIQGYADDEWDNSGIFFEIYSNEGELIGTLVISDIDNSHTWEWMNRPMKSFDFNSDAPEWSEEEKEEKIIFEQTQ
ncbi:hypothetical protein NIES267_64470 [Calothrix parasitica NIES-267]|uniref:Uncharacterized protein n=1 Tax=Calothrix parasitica NIES-267 TaxID=1973488 RepID=A0A1Z4M0E8_9CYAN|nr:hypothetical protein NIES267_64470 [Calothrix parasitica NIES-267]